MPDVQTPPRAAAASARPVGRPPRRAQVTGVVAVGLCLAYLVWRATSTLNPEAPVLAWGLWLLELQLVLGLVITTFNLWDPRPLRPADPSLPGGTVALCITTYNEPVEVLLPAIGGAVAVEGPHETWVLDDGARPEIRELAARLGARYLARPDNRHAKAGNLNHAMSVIDADFVAILDADHVPHPAFLRRTLPYFNDPDLALVQTPQEFYNDDSFEHVPVAGDRRGPALTEQSMFYGAIQPAKNRWGATFWCGTGAVVRAAALRSIGGIATESVTEDLQTTIRLHRTGWSTVFHNEVLAKGLAPPTAEEYLLQRRRWCIGGMQTLRIERPLRDRALSVPQRLAYAATFAFWFYAVRSLGLALLPALVLLSGEAPIRADWLAFLLAFAGFVVVQQVAVRQLAGRNTLNPLTFAMFELVRMEAILVALYVGLSGRAVPFAVTPKGRTSDGDRRVRAPHLLRALLAVYVLAGAWYAASVLHIGGLSYADPGSAHGAAAWLAVGGAVMVHALLRVRAERFSPERRRSHRHVRPLLARIADEPAIVSDLSLTGARLELLAGEPGGLPVGAPVALDLLHEHGDVRLDAVVVASGVREGRGTARVNFAPDQMEALASMAVGLFHPDALVEPGEIGAPDGSWAEAAVRRPVLGRRRSALAEP